MRHIKRIHHRREEKTKTGRKWDGLGEERKRLGKGGEKRGRQLVVEVKIGRQEKSNARANRGKDRY